MIYQYRIKLHPHLGEMISKYYIILFIFTTWHARFALNLAKRLLLDWIVAVLLLITSRSLLVVFLYYRKMQFRKLHQLLHVWKSINNKNDIHFLYILLTRNNIGVAFSKIEAISVDRWCFRFFNDYSNNKMCMNEMILTSLLFFIKSCLN